MPHAKEREQGARMRLGAGTACQGQGHSSPEDSLNYARDVSAPRAAQVYLGGGPKGGLKLKRFLPGMYSFKQRRYDYFSHSPVS